MHASAESPDLEAIFGLFAERDDLDGICELVRERIDDRILPAPDAVTETSPASMLLIPNLESRNLIADGSAWIGPDARAGALLGHDLVAAIPIMAIADGPSGHFADKEISVIPRVDVAVTIREVPAREEEKTMPRITKTRLEVAPHGVRDEIGRDA